MWFMYITIPKGNYYNSKVKLMSENEEQDAVKTVKLTKKGNPDQRNIKSAANVSKARSKAKAFLKTGNQIMHTSDD